MPNFFQPKKLEKYHRNIISENSFCIMLCKKKNKKKKLVIIFDLSKNLIIEMQYLLTFFLLISGKYLLKGKHLIFNAELFLIYNKFEKKKIAKLFKFLIEKP